MGVCPPVDLPPAASRSQPTSARAGPQIVPAPTEPPPRPADISVHCRVLSPVDRLRYSPGSLLVVVSASAAERDSFLERLIEDRASLLSLEKVRGLLAGRVAAEEVEARAQELLQAAVRKRLGGQGDRRPRRGRSAERRSASPSCAWRRMLKRPRHLILVETSRDQVREEDRAMLNELRRALDAGELGGEGFQTALRLSGGSAAEVKRILFRPPPREDSRTADWVKRGLVLLLDRPLRRVGVVQLARTATGRGRSPVIRSSGEPSGSRRPWRVPK